MTIFLKNKHTLQFDDFIFNCSIGKNGTSNNKIEGDRKTPRGTFKIEYLYYRKDRIAKPETSIKIIDINEKMGWCDDINYPKKYNKLIKIDKKIKCEKLKRRDHRYDFLIPIKYNFDNPIVGLGSCIFIHLTKNYKPSAGCITLIEKDFLIMLKLIKKDTMIKII